MVHRAIPSFWALHDRLPDHVRDRAQRQFSLLKADPRHPSLHFKKVGDSKGMEVWSARVTLHYRALALRRSNEFFWFWIGDHAAYEQMISTLQK